MTDGKSKLSDSDPLEPSADDYVGWTFTEDRAIFNPVVGFSKEWGAMSKPYAIVDLEVTGIHAESDEILEFAALLVEPSGAITSEFSALVKGEQPLKHEIIEIVDITQALVDLEGKPLADAMTAFLEFVGNRPAFIHHAEFYQSFLHKAGEKTGQVFSNNVYDLLFMAMMIWPDWSPHSSNRLMKRLGLPQVQGGTIGDAKSTLAILLATRDEAFSQNWD